MNYLFKLSNTTNNIKKIALGTLLISCLSLYCKSQDKEVSELRGKTISASNKTNLTKSTYNYSNDGKDHQKPIGNDFHFAGGYERFFGESEIKWNDDNDNIPYDIPTLSLVYDNIVETQGASGMTLNQIIIEAGGAPMHGVRQIARDKELFEKHFTYLTLEEIDQYRQRQLTEPKTDRDGNIRRTAEGKVEIIGQEGLSDKSIDKAKANPQSIEGRILAVFKQARKFWPEHLQALVADIDRKKPNSPKRSYVVEFDEFKIKFNVSYDERGNLAINSGSSYDDTVYEYNKSPSEYHGYNEERFNYYAGVFKEACKEKSDEYRYQIAAEYENAQNQATEKLN